MQLYEYRCPECSIAYTSSTRANQLDTACSCGHPYLQRVWSVNVQRPMQEHFNHAVGKPISDPKQFASELSRLSDEHSARDGMEHRYVPTDYEALRPSDVEIRPPSPAALAASTPP